MGTYTLFDIDTGESAIIENIDTSGDIHRRLLDLGFVKGGTVKCVGKSPSGDPAAFLVRGAVIALRSEDGRKISIQRVGGD